MNTLLKASIQLKASLIKNPNINAFYKKLV